MLSAPESADLPLLTVARALFGAEGRIQALIPKVDLH